MTFPFSLDPLAYNWFQKLLGGDEAITNGCASLTVLIPFEF